MIKKFLRITFNSFISLFITLLIKLNIYKILKIFLLKLKIFNYLRKIIIGKQISIIQYDNHYTEDYYETEHAKQILNQITQILSEK